MARCRPMWSDVALTCRDSRQTSFGVASARLALAPSLALAAQRMEHLLCFKRPLGRGNMK